MALTLVSEKQLSTLKFKNKIINGDMAVDSRNIGASHPIVASAWTYTIDRMVAFCTGANTTGQRVSGSDPGQYLYQANGATSVTGVAFGQRIGAYNIAHSIGKVVTLSALISSSVWETISWYAYYPVSADNYVTSTEITHGSFSISSTLTRYSVSFTVPANCDKGLFVFFYGAGLTSGNVKFGELQVEDGPNFTSFDTVELGVEFLRCEHYFRYAPLDLQFYSGIGGVLETGFNFPRMRVTPTIGANEADPYLSQTLVNCNNAGLIRATPYSVGAFAVGTAAGQCYCLGYRASLSAEIV